MQISNLLVLAMSSMLAASMPITNPNPIPIDDLSAPCGKAWQEKPTNTNQKEDFSLEATGGRCKNFESDGENMTPIKSIFLPKNNWIVNPRCMNCQFYAGKDCAIDTRIPKKQTDVPGGILSYRCGFAIQNPLFNPGAPSE